MGHTPEEIACSQKVKRKKKGRKEEKKNKLRTAEFRVLDTNAINLEFTPLPCRRRRVKHQLSHHLLNKMSHCGGN